MHLFGIVLVIFFAFGVVTSLHIGGTRSLITKKERRSISREAARNMHVKLPRVLLRKFSELSTYDVPKVGYLYHSIPVNVTHIKDEIFELNASYRQTNSTMFKVELWMEFPYIFRCRELQSAKFYVDITPITESEYMDRYRHCNSHVIAAKGRFPDDILEIKFDITSVYEACHIRDKLERFRFRLRFLSLSNRTEIDLSKNEVHAFLLFKEKDEIEDIIQLLPNSEKIERLHHETVLRQVPQVKSFGLPRVKVARKRTRKLCELKPFIFNFDDSGWKDYVIAPKQYQSNDCRGLCPLPLPAHLNATTYTFIKAVASTVDKKMKNPCCVASELAPLTMLVRDEDLKITLTIQKDMIAKSCRCA